MSTTLFSVEVKASCITFMTMATSTCDYIATSHPSLAYLQGLQAPRLEGQYTFLRLTPLMST